ncbi:MAG: hypothetical protein KAG34_09955 [Cocleimonas sp.]|nr:hypothetical protein [Cocleimonas sp.]
MKKILGIIILSFFTVGSTAITSATANAFEINDLVNDTREVITNARCKNKIIKGVGRGYSRSSAKKVARVFWRGKVVPKYGAHYGLWSHSKNKSNSCKRSWGLYRCVVRAKPCL